MTVENGELSIFNQRSAGPENNNNRRMIRPEYRLRRHLLSVCADTKNPENILTTGAAFLLLSFKLWEDLKKEKNGRYCGPRQLNVQPIITRRPVRYWILRK